MNVPWAAMHPMSSRSDFPTLLQRFEQGFTERWSPVTLEGEKCQQRWGSASSLRPPQLAVEMGRLSVDFDRFVLGEGLHDSCIVADFVSDPSEIVLIERNLSDQHTHGPRQNRLHGADKRLEQTAAVTKRSIDGIPYPAAGQILYRDKDLTGFGLKDGRCRSRRTSASRRG